MKTKEELKAIEEERGKVYGKPRESHVNIGLSWTGLLQQHYGIVLDHPVPDYLVAQMLVAFKNQRSCRVYKADNYDDLHVYAGFAEEFQKGEAQLIGVDLAKANEDVLFKTTCPRCSFNKIWSRKPDLFIVCDGCSFTFPIP